MTATTTQPATTSASAARAAGQIRRHARGRVALPSDDAYTALCTTWTGASDQRPALVVEAMCAADVQTAVRAAREHGLRLVTQATGHGTHARVEGALLLRTTAMREVLVDPDRRTARVGPGATWGDVLTAAAPLGLAPVSGTHASVGVGGYTLHGGVGQLARRFGLGADNLLRADVVTADGALVSAGPGEHAHLHWALRGGGGSFGVVTGLEVRLHRVSRVVAGTAYFPIAHAADLLLRFRDWIEDAGDELSATVVLHRSSPDPRIDGPVVAVRGLHLGTPARARRALTPLWQTGGGAPLVDGWRPVPYARAAMQSGVSPRQFELVRDLPHGLVAALVDAIAAPDGPGNAIEVRHWGGAMGHAGGPTGHRDVPFSLTVDADPGSTPALAAYATGGAFRNFLSDTTRTADAYTPADFRRLREVKRTYDPDCVFDTGHDLRPAAQAPRRLAA
ncbi:FAD-binding oxidoreductase [Conexibacter sp. SYSU D00693]|uniref:FAD-binding oxidoreductase n=1 Tax=Conexibacter sp. SYSU D00693 TaxID=2812560 RepID=UPI00196A6CE4|nr:FAD-binding oxidoreductase [Conexibacter sp. SYSU D00693]